MLTIDRLRLTLPAGYEARAERIARLVGDHLASASMSADARFDRLRVPRVDVAHGASDHDVAGAIANAITAQVGRGGER